MSISRVKGARYLLRDPSMNAFLGHLEGRTTQDCACKNGTVGLLHHDGTECSSVTASHKRSIDEISSGNDTSAFSPDNPLIPKELELPYHAGDEGNVAHVDTVRMLCGFTSPKTRIRDKSRRRNTKRRVFKQSANMNTTGDKADAGGNQPSRNTNNSNAVNPSSNLQSTGQSGNPSTAAGTSAYEAFIQQKIAQFCIRIQTGAATMVGEDEMKRLSARYEDYARKHMKLPDGIQAPGVDNGKDGKDGKEAKDAKDAKDPATEETSSNARKAPELLPPPDFSSNASRSRGDTSTYTMQPPHATPTANSNTQDVNNSGPSIKKEDDVRQEEEMPAPSASRPQVRYGENGVPIIERNAICSVEKMIAEEAKNKSPVDGLLKLMKTTTEYDDIDILDGV